MEAASPNLEKQGFLAVVFVIGNIVYSRREGDEKRKSSAPYFLGF